MPLKRGHTDLTGSGQKNCCPCLNLIESPVAGLALRGPSCKVAERPSGNPALYPREDLQVNTLHHGAAGNALPRIGSSATTSAWHRLLQAGMLSHVSVHAPF